MIPDLTLGFTKTLEAPAAAPQAGFRFGAKGTHTSRTLMLSDLEAVLASVPAGSPCTRYGHAIIEENCLGKPTVATRHLTLQRLTELYALDPDVPLFRIMRQLWDLEYSAHGLLALLCAIARDPLLRATAEPVLSLQPGAELLRDPVRRAVRENVGSRLSDATLEKVLRNAASSWTQSGHLEGRTFKKRKLVNATAACAALALYLAYVAGFRGPEIFTSGWFAVLDCTPSRARDLVFEAKRFGILDVRVADDVIDLDLARLEEPSRRYR